jgi:hypothetical protein
LVLKKAGKGIFKVSGVESVVYYSVAHSLYFDHDINLQNQYAVLDKVQSNWTQIHPKTGMPSAPFPIGFSLLQIPSLFLADIACKLGLSSETCDGFNKHYFSFYYAGNVIWASIAIFTMISLARRWLDKVRPQVKSPYFPTFLVLLLWCLQVRQATTYLPQCLIQRLY